MTAESFKQRGATFRNLGRVMFHLRILVILAILATVAIWLDYWIRGELGIAEKFLVYARGEWGRGVLISGGIIYILLLSLPFVPGVELGILLMCVFGKEGVVFVYAASRRISWRGFLLTIGLAVSPVPIFVYLGIIQLEAFLGV